MADILVLIRGLSGSGKTSLMELIVGSSEYCPEDRASVSVDDFFMNDEGDYQFDPTQLKAAHEWCLDTATEFVKDEDLEVVVVHNVFSRKWEIDPYMEMGRAHGCTIHVVNLYDRGLNDAQLSKHSVHDVHPGIVQKQRKRWDKDVYRDKSRFHDSPRHPYPPRKFRY